MKTSVSRIVLAMFAGTRAVATSFRVTSASLDNPRQLKKMLKSKFHEDNPDIEGKVALDVEVVARHFIVEDNGRLSPVGDHLEEVIVNQVVCI